MTLDDYQEQAMATAVYPGQGGTLGVLYNALALGEVGEIQGKVSKLIRDKGLIAHSPYPEYDEEDFYFSDVQDDDAQELLKEMGDVLWHLTMLANDLGYSLESVARANLAKLKSRQERGTLQGSGDNR